MSKVAILKESGELLKNYPKSASKLKSWIARETGEDITKIDDTTLSIIIMYNPRILYDFFDEEDIFLQIGLISLLKISDGWGYNISYKKDGSTINTDEDKTSTDRVECEILGFKDCFKILEEKL